MSFQQSKSVFPDSIFKQSFEPTKLPLWMPARVISEYDVSTNLYGENIGEQNPVNMKQFKFINRSNDLEAMRRFYSDKIFQSRTEAVERLKYISDSTQPNIHTIYPNVTFLKK